MSNNDGSFGFIIYIIIALVAYVIIKLLKTVFSALFLISQTKEKFDDSKEEKQYTPTKTENNLPSSVIYNNLNKNFKQAKIDPLPSKNTTYYTSNSKYTSNNPVSEEKPIYAYCDVCKKETEQCQYSSHRDKNKCIICNGGPGYKFECNNCCSDQNDD